MYPRFTRCVLALSLLALFIAPVRTVAAQNPASPCIVQSARIVSTSDVSPARLGYTLAISGDGNTLAATISNNAGAGGPIRIFARSAGTWAYQALLTFGAPASTAYGTQIALSHDGSTLVVGAQGTSSNFGAAYVYTRDGAGNWSQQGPALGPTGNTAAAPRFGSSVALSADGNTALIGALFDPDSYGSFYTFTRTGGVWSQVARTVSYTFSGTRIFLNTDATIAYQIGQGAFMGRYTRSGAGWVVAGTGFGSIPDLGVNIYSPLMTVSGDGQIAFTYTSIANSPLVPFGPALTNGFPALTNERLGIPRSTVTNSYSTLAANLTGSRLVAGSPQSDAGRGATFLFSRGGVGGSVGTSLLPVGTAAGALQFGAAIAIDAAGSTVAVGAPAENVGPGLQGAVYIFTINPTSQFTLVPQNTTATIGDGAVFTCAVSASDSSIPITYSWTRNGQPISDGPLPSGATASLSSTPGLVLTGLTLADDSAVYQCTVTTGCGSLVTPAVSLKVTSPCRADIASTGGAPVPDGTVTVDDLIRYLSEFFSACP